MKLLFVCMGNICRSPTAEAVMRELVDSAGLDAQVEIDSAGTGDWHVGEPADRRAREAAARRGLWLDGFARQIRPDDLDEFDLVLAADRTNQAELLRLAGEDRRRRAKVRLLREFDPASVQADELEVPDPYLSDDGGFERVLDICEAACAGLLSDLVASGRVAASGEV